MRNRLAVPILFLATIALGSHEGLAQPVLLRTLQKPTPAPSDELGTSVAVAGNKVLVGAPFDGTRARWAGAAYVFDASTGALLFSLTHPAAGGQDAFHGMDLRLRYDPGALRLEGVSHPQAGGLTATNTRTPGLVRVVGVSMQGFEAPGGRLATLTFIALKGGGQEVRLDAIELLDALGANVPVRLPGESDGEAPPPTAFRLFQNYPNPFNPQTTVRYDLPEAGPVRIDIYNALGQRVDTVEHPRQEAGRHTVVWKSDGFASGVYLFSIEAGSLRETMKMVLLK